MLVPVFIALLTVAFRGHERETCPVARLPYFSMWHIITTCEISVGVWKCVFQTFLAVASCIQEMVRRIDLRTVDFLACPSSGPIWKPVRWALAAATVLCNYAVELVRAISLNYSHALSLKWIRVLIFAAYLTLTIVSYNSIWRAVWHSYTLGLACIWKLVDAAGTTGICTVDRCSYLIGILAAKVNSWDLKLACVWVNTALRHQAWVNRNDGPLYQLRLNKAPVEDAIEIVQLWLDPQDHRDASRPGVVPC